MPIPVRCFTCGKTLADTKNYYQSRVRTLRFKQDKVDVNVKKDEVYNVHVDEIKKQIEAEVLDELGLVRECCRSSMLSFLDD